jgi:hypothetical protein
MSYKNPPEMRDGLLYEDWKKELEIWCSFTDLDKKRQGPAIFLTLKGKARETVLADVDSAKLKDDTGVKEITTALDKLYVKDKSESAFVAFENFIKFKRSTNMSIKDFSIEFNLRLSKIKTHKMDLPDGVLAYYLLSSANLTEEQTSLCRATCAKLTYTDMKTQIERVSVSSVSPSSNASAAVITVEPQYVAQYQQYDEAPYYYDEEPGFEQYEEEELAVQDTYYNRPGSMPGMTSQPRGGRFFNSSAKKQTNPIDEYGNPAPCRFCKSIYHWVDRCPDAPAATRSTGAYRARGARRGLGYPNRGRGRSYGGRGGYNTQFQF